MTEKEANRLVYCYYSRGRLEDEAKEYGYKGNVEKASRTALERFVIKKLTQKA